MAQQNKIVIMDKLSLVFSIIGLLLSCIFIGIIPAFVGFILSIICLTQGQKYNKKLSLSSLIISIIAVVLFVVLLIATSSSETENSNIAATGGSSSSSPSELSPTAMPSLEPTTAPTQMPTATPAPKPTATPTPEPTATPQPTAAPAPEPTATPQPTAAPAENNSSASNNNNFDTYDNAQQQQTDETYVLNTSTMKIHRPSCKSVPKIAPENYSTSSESLETLEANGYSTCGICF